MIFLFMTFKTKFSLPLFQFNTYLYMLFQFNTSTWYHSSEGAQSDQENCRGVKNRTMSNVGALMNIAANAV